MNSSRILGNLFKTGDGRLEGWCWSIDDPSNRAMVEILLNGQVISTIVAARKNDDLVVLGIGDGYHSFSAPFPIIVDPVVQDTIIEARERFSKALFGRVVVKKNVSLDYNVTKLLTIVNAFNAISTYLRDYTVKSNDNRLIFRFLDLGLLLQGHSRPDNSAASPTTNSVLASEYSILSSLPRLEIPYFPAPAVTVIISALDTFRNSYAYIVRISDMLEDLKCELILIDGSSDPTNALLGTRVRNFKYIKNTGIFFSSMILNQAALSSRGGRLLFIDKPEYISRLTIRRIIASAEDEIISDFQSKNLSCYLKLINKVESSRSKAITRGSYFSMLRRTYLEVGGFDNGDTDGSEADMRASFVLKASHLGVETIAI